MRRSYRIAALAALAHAVPGLSSVAQAERQIAVVALGTCPAREAVTSALVLAMPDIAILADATASPAGAEPVVVVFDDGASYRVVVGGIMRTLLDTPAHCEERARKIAVVVALALDPPLIASPASGAIEAVADARPAPLPMPGIDVRFETGAFAEYAWHRSSTLWPVGSTARLAISRGAVGLVVGGAWPTWLTIDGAALVQRIPVEIALQLRSRRGWHAGALELGPTLVFQRSRTTGMQFRSVDLEADVRMSARIELWPRQGYGVFAAVTGTYVPEPAPMRLPVTFEPLPDLWFGASAGVAFLIH